MEFNLIRCNFFDVKKEAKEQKQKTTKYKKRKSVEKCWSLHDYLMAWFELANHWTSLWWPLGPLDLHIYRDVVRPSKHYSLNNISWRKISTVRIFSAKELKPTMNLFITASVALLVLTGKWLNIVKKNYYSILETEGLREVRNFFPRFPMKRTRAPCRSGQHLDRAKISIELVDFFY